MIGLIAGTKRAVVPLLPLQLHADEPRERPREERDAEVDEDALGDLRHADLDEAALQAEERRQDRDEEPGVDAVEEDLEDAVEGDEPRGVLGVALRQLVPDDDHRDAAREADHDEARHVLRAGRAGRRSARTNIRIGPTTQFWTSDRPTTFRSRKTSPISSYLTFAKGGYIIRMSPMAIGMFVVPTWNELTNDSTPGMKAAGEDPRGHRREDPERQPAVEERELLADAIGHGACLLGTQRSSGESGVGHQAFAGFTARTKALRNLPSTSGPMASTSIPAEARKSRASATL